MLSKEDQRRFDEITGHLRSSDPRFFARLESRARGRRGRMLLLLTVVLWASLPGMAVLGGWVAASVCAAAVAATGALAWRTRHRFE